LSDVSKRLRDSEAAATAAASAAAVAASGVLTRERASAIMALQKSDDAAAAALAKVTSMTARNAQLTTQLEVCVACTRMLFVFMSLERLTHLFTVFNATFSLPFV
jgi:hypothetical protein